MNKLLIPFTFLLSITSLGQEIECQYPPTGDYTGVCESFYADGSIRSQTDFSNSLRNGNHREYYKNGQLAAIATFHQEYYVGKAYRYSQDSIKILEMTLDSTETGEFTAYSKNGKQIIATGKFKNSYRDGDWMFYNELGELIKTVSYDSDETRKKIEDRKKSSGMYIIPYEETIDKLFLEDYGMPDEVNPETIIDFPDVPAEFPSSVGLIQDFLNENVNYPLSAIEKNETGTVYLSFVVELDGSFSEVEVLRGVSESLDNEAIRLIKSMPNWIPGQYNGQNVRTRCRTPIVFSLTNSKN